MKSLKDDDDQKDVHQDIHTPWWLTLDAYANNLVPDIDRIMDQYLLDHQWQTVLIHSKTLYMKQFPSSCCITPNAIDAVKKQLNQVKIY